MSLVPRCGQCCELVTRCRCHADRDHRLHLTDAEKARLDAYQRRFMERGWL